MSQLNENFQKLTGINGFDVEKYIEEAENKTKAYNDLQWKISKGLIRDHNLYRNDDESVSMQKLKLYANVMIDIAKECNVSSDKNDVDNIDINSNESTNDAADKKAQEILSEAYAILEDGYDSEDEDDNISSN